MSQLKKSKPKRNKWTYENLLEHANRCLTRSEFQKKYPSAYITAYRKNILDEICQHMGRYKHTKEEIIALAANYETRMDFKKAHNAHYHAAHYLNILDEACSHMTRRVKWSAETLVEEAKKYNSRSEFQKNSASAYNSARNLRILDAICGHMKPSRALVRSKDEMIELLERLPYKSLTEIQEQAPEIIRLAKSKGAYKLVKKYYDEKYIRSISVTA